MRIGVDLGGTKIEALALGDDGVELWRRRTPTPRDDYDAIVREIAALVTAAEKDLGKRGTVGVGIPGTRSPTTGLIKNANTVTLIGHPLDRDLSAALEREVRLANDADCFAISEATDGAGAGAASVFGAILGTGCGSGLVHGGRLIQGINGITGEWGHNPLPWPRQWTLPDGRVIDERPGPACYCGRHGCNELFLSGTGFALDYAVATGRERPAPEIADAAASGEAAARASLERYTDRLSRGLASVINLFDPEVIVLGGGMSNIDSLYTEVPRRWGEFVFSDHVATKLRPPAHGDSSGVRGAAWLWPA